MELDINELRELLTVFNQTEITELTLKSNDFELTLRKSAPTIVRELSEASVGVLPSPLPISVESKDVASSKQAATSLAPESGTATSTPPPTLPQADQKWISINSPMVGTFYRSPAPDEPPFVDVGDRIRLGQTVCIIEAMKLMNEIEAEVSGQVMEILVQNGQPVEYGQILMRINPDG